MNSLSIESNAVPRPALGTPSPALELEAGQAARLLNPTDDTQALNAARLGVGLAGLVVLGSITHPYFAEALQSFSEPVRWRPFALALAAALTIAISLPGLLILLPMLGHRVPIDLALSSVCRQYARLGILAFGLSPVLALYALSGAAPKLIMLMTACGYLAAGALSLAHLFRDLHRALDKRTLGVRICLLIWAFYVGLLAAYLFAKLNFGSWS